MAFSNASQPFEKQKQVALGFPTFQASMPERDWAPGVWKKVAVRVLGPAILAFCECPTKEYCFFVAHMYAIFFWPAATRSVGSAAGSINVWWMYGDQEPHMDASLRIGISFLQKHEEFWGLQELVFPKGWYHFPKNDWVLICFFFASSRKAFAQTCFTTYLYLQTITYINK